jgi:hypothetical protein
MVTKVYNTHGLVSKLHDPILGISSSIAVLIFGSN